MLTVGKVSDDLLIASVDQATEDSLNRRGPFQLLEAASGLLDEGAKEERNSQGKI